MKVLFTASTFSHIDHFHKPYLRQFRSLGWEAHVACGGEGTDIPADRLVAVPLRKRMACADNLRATAALRALIARERYDLVVTHTSLASFFTRLAVKGLRHRPPLCNVMHGYLFDDDTPAVKRWALAAAERLTAAQTDLLLTMNRWDYEYAARRHLARRVERIPGMGVDFTGLDRVTAPKEALRERLGLPRDAFLMVCAAEFSPRKSQGVLIDAMAALPENAVLALAGDGALLEDCRARAARLGLDGRVRFMGYVQDMAPLYRAADIAVSASRSEGLPFNLMEAMYCGLPAVASAVKGHVDLIDDDENGLLYPYGDSAAFAQRVRALMPQAGKRREMAAAQRRRARDYALERVLPGVMEKYLSIVDARGLSIIK